MRRRLAAGPAPDLHVPGVEVRILLQGWRCRTECLSYVKESGAKPNLTLMLRLSFNGWTITLPGLYRSAV